MLNIRFRILFLGSGTTNDGNSARRFFKHAEKTAEITGVDITLIKRFGTLLNAMASGHAINVDAFDKFALQTAELFVDLYSWYYMPASVHKMLIHGADIIKHALLPIGNLFNVYYI